MAKLSYCARCLTTFREADAHRCPNLSCGMDVPEDGWGEILEAGDLIDRHYRIDRVLAVGGAGLTYLAKEVGQDDQPMGPDLAVKVLYSARASGAYLRRLATEAQILQELDHDNIVQCRGFVHRSGHEPYLVTLFEQGGSLGHHIERTGPVVAKVAAGVLRQILLALDTAHQRGVVHRDLKPDNVLLSQKVDAETIPHVRVADFGIAKVHGGLSSRITKLGSFIGTPEYAAPEQFEQLAPTAATDIFACGGLLLFMLTGKPPVTLSRRGDVESSYEELLDQLPPIVHAGNAPQTTLDEQKQINTILAHAMVVRAEHRWTAHQVIAALRPLISPELRKGPETLELTHDPPPNRGKAPAPSTFAMSSPPRAEEPEPAVLVSGSDSPPAVPEPSPPTKPVETSAAPFDSGPPSAGRALGLGVMLFGVVAAGVGLLAIGVVGFGLVSVIGLSNPPPPEFDPAGAVTLTGAERLALQSALQAPAASVGKACDAEGGVVLTLVADPEGVLWDVDVDKGYQSSEAGRCIQAQVLALTVAPSSNGVRARVALDL